jgi:hypothetical protein
VDLAQQLGRRLDRPFPWRTATLVAAGVAVAELVGLLALAGVHLAPGIRSRAAGPATSPPKTAARPLAPVVRSHPLRARSTLSVLVLNGNGVGGAAGVEATRLLARGYRHAIPADASSDYARSLVLFAPGYLRDAKRLARDSGIGAVSALDGMSRAQLRGSQLVVILGGS